MRRALAITILVGSVGCDPAMFPPYVEASPTSSTTVTSVAVASTQARPGEDSASADARVEQDADALAENLWPGDLLHAAHTLASLSVAQRTRIGRLIDEQNHVDADVRAARSQLLSAVAGAVDSATVSVDALSAAVDPVVRAMVAAEPEDRRLLETLHATLSPSQRAELGKQVASRERAVPGAREPGAMSWMSRMLDLTNAQRTLIDMNLRAVGRLPEDEARENARRARMRFLRDFARDTFVAAPRSSEAIRESVDRVVVLAEVATPALSNLQREALSSALRAWAVKPELGR